MIKVPSNSLTDNAITVMGFSGEKTTLPYTKPLRTTIGPQTVHHAFVHSPTAPTNLMGRDLLTTLGATILCSPDGLEVRLPDGTVLPCVQNGQLQNGQYLVQPVTESHADIYWGLLQPETPTHGGILSVYLLWKPWIAQIHPLISPPDPPHVTLFYDRMQTEWYQDQFQEIIEGQTWDINSQNIYVAPEGVAAGVFLTEEQSKWYMMEEEAAPHISLALHPKHEAKELGSIVKKALRQTDWKKTNLPQVTYSPSTKIYKISLTAVDQATLQHLQISRHHGRERKDHPEAEPMINSLPDSLWAEGPTDVGLVACSPVTFSLQSDDPIWIKQYPHSLQAEEGIKDTITGLLEKEVLEPSQSGWNTPILPVEKKGTGKYRMAHNLRAINEALSTKTVPVPNPYVALTNLSPTHEWFTCIDLANAFFCLPLAPECRDIFFVHLPRQTAALHPPASRVCVVPRYFQSSPEADLKTMHPT